MLVSSYRSNLLMHDDHTAFGRGAVLGRQNVGIVEMGDAD